MTKHFLVNQLKHETHTPASFVKKLYDLISKQELTEDEYDNTTNFDGEITLATPTYRQWVDKIHEYFPDLIINGEFYILFQDHTVEEIMAAYLLTKEVGDGIGITEENAKDKKITSIPSFRNNTDIQYFNELPYFERVTSLQGRCFQSCTNLKEIDLSNITLLDKTMAGSHFEGCTNLTKVTLGNITDMPGSCFYGCTNLETIINSENIRTVSNSAFRNCISLESIDLSNVIKVDYDAFWGCAILSDIGSLSNVVSFGNNSFSGCSKLGTINIENVETMGGSVFNNCLLLKLENPTLSKCRSINSSAFYKTAIEEINLPVCTEINGQAFAQCSLLRSISMPSIQTLGGSVFYGDSLLSIDVNLPNLSTMGQEVFKGTGITKITSLGNITTIPVGSFENCKSLSSIEPDILNNIIKINNNAFYGCSALTSITGLSNLTNIGRWAFGSTALTNISFDMSKITVIDSSAFNDSKSLVFDDLNLPNLMSLGEKAFRSTKVKKISNLGNNITTIPQECFYECTALTAIENDALSNITELSQHAFNGCTSLTTIGDISNVVKIGNSALSGTIINSIDLSKVKRIDTAGVAINTAVNFKLTDAGAIDLTSIEHLDNFAFNYRNNRHDANSEYIDLGTHLAFIGTQPLSMLNVHVIIRSTTPPEFYANGYGHLDTAKDHYVYVPDEALNTYRGAYPGNTTNIKPISELPVELQ